jgi:hypothetical protein
MLNAPASLPVQLFVGDLMRALPALLCAVVLVACGPREETPEPAAESNVAAPSLADFAGTWSNEVRLEGVPDPVQTTMRGGADGNWTMSFPGGPTDIPLRAHVAGDSLIGESAEYESVLRPGVMVTVRTASVMQDGALAGSVLATYRTPQGAEEVPGTVRSTRIE